MKCFVPLIQSAQKAPTTQWGEFDTKAVSSRDQGKPGGIMPVDHTEQSAKPRVLVVDDNLMSRKVITLRLSKDGYDVHAVASGQEALDDIAATDTDLVFLDLKMEGMSGREVLSAIKADPQQSQIPVVIVSGVEDPDTIEACLADGASDFLNKPVQADTLREVVDDLIGSRHAQGGSEEAAIDLNAAAIFNPDSLKQLESDYGADKVQEFVSRFQALAHGQMQAIGAAAQSEDLADLTRAVSGLKGTARTLGLARLAAACRVVERAAAAGQGDDAAQAADGLRTQLSDALAVFTRRAEDMP